MSSKSSTTRLAQTKKRFGALFCCYCFLCSILIGSNQMHLLHSLSSSFSFFLRKSSQCKCIYSNPVLSQSDRILFATYQMESSDLSERFSDLERTQQKTICVNHVKKSLIKFPISSVLFVLISLPSCSISPFQFLLAFHTFRCARDFERIRGKF